MRYDFREKAVEGGLAALALLSLAVLAGIVFYLFREGLPVFASTGFLDFVFGTDWYPVGDQPDFEIGSLIAGSLAVTFLASLFAVPLGLMTAAYLSEVAANTTRRIIKPFIELLAALPSVVIGFIGMVLVAPWLQNTLGIATGLNLFNAALMLAFMAVPTICSIAEDALHAVPRSLNAIVPESIFDPIRPMPASIAAEMAEAPFGSPHYHALFATGIALFVMTFIFNAIAFRLAQKYKTPAV